MTAIHVDLFVDRYVVQTVLLYDHAIMFDSEVRLAIP